MKLPVVRNSAGEPITLNAQEKRIADYNERICNSLGYEVPITTLTQIGKKISEQKYFEVAPADYIPLVVGQGAWSSNILTYRSFDAADQFETGIINVGGQNDRLAMADAAVDSVTVQVLNWAKKVGWSIPELELAARSGNWDVVSAKEEARKRNWDLGIQRIAFLGARGQNGSTGNVFGLLNQGDVTINTTTITEPISGMTSAELKAFVAVVVENYRSNCNRTAWPTHFVIPESDYNGLASQASPDFPIKSTKQLLEEAFKEIVPYNKFKAILPLAYGDAAYHADVASIAGKQVYALYNYDEKSLRMDVPVDYTNTLANSVDNFMFQNVGYGQFTGAKAYRPLEMLYYQY